ncbi:MAG: hypothetical protein ACYCWE_16585 [Eubacteriales bacterium]
MKTRCICILLAMLILLPVIASCADSTGNAENTTAAGTADTIGNDETDRSQTPDTIPDGLNFDGTAYRILVRDDQFLPEFYAEEASGDIVQDTIYNRNVSVEERLNVKIEIIKGVPSSSYGSELANIRTNVTAGDDAYEVIAGYSVHIVKLLAEGLFVNLNEIEYLDFTQPWWPESIQDEMTFNGSLYFMTGDICMTTISKALCMYFNKSIAESRNIGNIYDTVNTNAWTFDAYLSITKDVYEDLDGNAKADDNDLYGTVMTPYNSVDAFIPAFRQDITQMGEDGYPELAFNTERMISIVERVYSLLYETTGVHVPRNSLEDAATMFKMFKANQALFMMWEFTATDELRSMESDFGIIPYPKWDENQEGYGTYMQDGHTLLCVPITNLNLDMTGAVTEALAAESYRYVTPAYFEVALQVKYSRDDESVAMLQLVKDSIKYNFGYVYLVDAFWVMRTLMNANGNKGSTDFASYYAKNEKTFNKTLTKMIEKYEENLG